MSRPDLSRVPQYYHNYINQVQEDDLLVAFKNQTPGFIHFLEELPAEKRDHRYAEGKWTVKELVQHIIDAERIFCYRGLRFARKDSTPLPGFEENDYAANAKTDHRNWNDLIDEFKALRRSTELMYGSFDEDQMEQSGVASNNSTYVKAIGFIMVGHVNHHVKVIKERYL